MRNPYFSAPVTSVAKASFTVDPNSVLDAYGVLAQDVEFGPEGNRVQRREWKENHLPRRGEMIYFQLVPAKKRGERIVNATLLNLDACIGDDSTLPPQRQATADPRKEEQAIHLAFGGIFAAIRNMRDALARGWKARAAARS